MTKHVHAKHVHAKLAHDARLLQEQVLQALQTELGAIDVLTAAMPTGNTDQMYEWTEALDEARAYRDVLLNVLVNLGGDPDAMTPGRRLAMHHGDSLVQAIEAAKLDGDAMAARSIAAECVALAERMTRQCRDRLGLLLERSRKRTRWTREPAGARCDTIPASVRAIGARAAAFGGPLASRAA